MKVSIRKPEGKVQIFEFASPRFIWVVLNKIDKDKISDLVSDMTKSWSDRGYKVLITSIDIEEIQILRKTTGEGPLKIKVINDNKQYKFYKGKVAWIRINDDRNININKIISNLTEFFGNLGLEILVTSWKDQELELVNGDIIESGVVR
jgi:hypothetical protein